MFNGSILNRDCTCSLLLTLLPPMVMFSHFTNTLMWSTWTAYGPVPHVVIHRFTQCASDGGSLSLGPLRSSAEIRWGTRGLPLPASPSLCTGGLLPVLYVQASNCLFLMYRWYTSCSLCTGGLLPVLHVQAVYCLFLMYRQYNARSLFTACSLYTGGLLHVLYVQAV